METLQELKKAQEEEFTQISKGQIFWAFSEKQFIEGCAEIGATKNEAGKWNLVHVFGGGFAKPEFIEVWKEHSKKWKEKRRDFLRDKKKRIDAIVYELANHEAFLDNAESFKMNCELAKEISEEDFAKAWKIYYKDCIGRL